jgi:hypothetical protein
VVQTPSEEAAWCAGLIDGEGSIGVYNGRLMLRCQMTDEPTIRALQARLGGTVRRQDRRPPRGASWMWFCRSRDLMEALKRMRPHMVTKAVEFDTAIKLLTNPLLGLAELDGLHATLKERKQRKRVRAPR